MASGIVPSLSGKNYYKKWKQLISMERKERERLISQMTLTNLTIEWVEDDPLDKFYFKNPKKDKNIRKEGDISRLIYFDWHAKGTQRIIVGITLESSLNFIWEENRGRCMSNIVDSNTTITTTFEPTAMEGLKEKNMDTMNLFLFNYFYYKSIY